MGSAFDDYVYLAEQAYDEDGHTQASYDRRQREALERQSPSASRRNFVQILNDSERQRAASELTGLVAITKVRDGHFARVRGVHPARSTFNFLPSDPGQVRGSRFEWAEGAPKLSAGRVTDAEGRLRSADARARDHWASGKVEAVPTDWMLAEARRLIPAVRQRAYGRKPV